MTTTKTKAKKTRHLPYGEVNTDLFLRVKKAILAEPKRLDMDTWLDTYDPKYYDEAPKCGTVGCIAGWAVVLTRVGREPKSMGPVEKTCADVLNMGFDKNVAARQLGLSYETMDKVFHLSNWPILFYRKWAHAKGREQQAQVVADYIDYICGEGE